MIFETALKIIQYVKNTRMISWKLLLPIYYFYFSGKLPAAMQTAGVGTHLHFGLFILVAIHGAFCVKKQTVILLWKNISTLYLKE